MALHGDFYAKLVLTLILIVERGVPVSLQAEWQENSAKPCDTGTPIRVMEREWPQFDWSSVDPEYPSKEGLYGQSFLSPTNHVQIWMYHNSQVVYAWYLGRLADCITEWSRQGLTERGIAAKKWISERPEKIIAVVSHSGFLRVGITAGKEFENADYRIFEFGDNLELKEWDLTESKGGGLGKSKKEVRPMHPGDYPERVETEVVDELPK